MVDNRKFSSYVSIGKDTLIVIFPSEEERVGWNNLDNSSSLVTQVANTNFCRGAAASVWQSLI
jgi:hypothetical protein